MNLQEFVRNSLIQLCQGVNEARTKNPNIAPHAFSANQANDATLATLDSSSAYPVEFDVAVTISDKAGRINVASVKLEGSSSISRLKFSVPVVYTKHPDAGLLKLRGKASISGKA